MQNLGLPRQAPPEKGKAHAKGKRSSICWVRTKHERLDILGCGGIENYDNEPSKIQ